MPPSPYSLRETPCVFNHKHEMPQHLIKKEKKQDIKVTNKTAEGTSYRELGGEPLRGGRDYGENPGNTYFVFKD